RPFARDADRLRVQAHEVAGVDVLRQVVEATLLQRPQVLLADVGELGDVGQFQALRRTCLAQHRAEVGGPAGCAPTLTRRLARVAGRSRGTAFVAVVAHAVLSTARAGALAPVAPVVVVSAAPSLPAAPRCRAPAGAGSVERMRARATAMRPARMAFSSNKRRLTSTVRPCE